MRELNGLLIRVVEACYVAASRLSYSVIAVGPGDDDEACRVKVGDFRKDVELVLGVGQTDLPHLCELAEEAIAWEDSYGLKNACDVRALIDLLLRQRSFCMEALESILANSFEQHTCDEAWIALNMIEASHKCPAWKHLGNEPSQEAFVNNGIRDAVKRMREQNNDTNL